MLCQGEKTAAQTDLEKVKDKLQDTITMKSCIENRAAVEVKESDKQRFVCSNDN